MNMLVAVVTVCCVAGELKSETLNSFLVSVQEKPPGYYPSFVTIRDEQLPLCLILILCKVNSLMENSKIEARYIYFMYTPKLNKLR